MAREEGGALPSRRDNAISRKNRVEQHAGVTDNQRMNDYERVAKIIRFLDAGHVGQPNLDELATRLSLSRYHFHRLFSRWAGVTPKDFLQCLTLAHARERLQRGASVLDTTLEVGLSSPGRLHDLCVALEAATPGEIKSGGEGWVIDIGFTESPFGICCVGISPRGVCHLAFVESAARKVASAPLRHAWPRAQLRWDNATAQKLGAQIFRSPENGQRVAKGSPANSKRPQDAGGMPLRAFVPATPFQLRVWRALLHVPPGALVSYSQLAIAIGSPRAARAVGSAVGSNPLAFLIPCHRVIRETGVVGEYRWGPERKRLMLGWETGIDAPRF